MYLFSISPRLVHESNVTHSCAVWDVSDAADMLGLCVVAVATSGSWVGSAMILRVLQGRQIDETTGENTGDAGSGVCVLSKSKSKLT